MTATITDRIKREMLKKVFDRTQNIGIEVNTDSDRHFLAIGRCSEWPDEADPPTPTSAADEELKFRSSIQAMKLITDVSYVVPRHSWNSGNFYEAWSTQYNSNTTIGATTGNSIIPNPYYVLTDENNVFICVQQGKTVSGVARPSLYKPTNTADGVFPAGDDGYFWKYMYNIGAELSRKFLTSAYMPVERIVDLAYGGPSADDLSISRLNQRSIQAGAIPGQLIGIAIDNPGRDYVSPPTITIKGVPRKGVIAKGTTNLSKDGHPVATGAIAAAKINDGGISDVIMKNAFVDTAFTFGQNYTDASIFVSGGGGSGAVLRAIVSHDSGMGGNPIIDLNSTALMFTTQLTGSENEDFPTTNDFRQIGIIRNPHRDSAQYGSFPLTGEDSYARASTLRASKALHVTTTTLNAINITGDQSVSQVSSPSVNATIDYYDGNGILYVHQTRETGYMPFDSNSDVTVSGGGGSATTIANAVNDMPILRPAEVDNFSGEILYIDNRTAVSRDADQTEDIKVVIDL